jgi:hypothetical protein
MDCIEKEALSFTLKLANISLSLSKIIIVDASQSDPTQNKRVRDKTNRLLLDLLRKNDVGVCIHVTGEMRALTDPFHRHICEEMRRRNEQLFYVLYKIPQDRISRSVSAVGWNLSRWATGQRRNWEEELRTIDVIAKRSVDLFAYNTLDLDTIQYSVFGNKYVLLQEKHRDRVKSKRVWLLESEQLNDLLTDRGQSLLRDAMEIKTTLFCEFAGNVGGIPARRYLRMLKETNLETTELLSDSFVRYYIEKPQDILDTLKVMGFIRQLKERVCITPSGRQFLSLY